MWCSNAPGPGAALFGAPPLRVGSQAPGQRLRPGHQRLGHPAAFLPLKDSSSKNSGRCPLTTAVECFDSGKLPVEVLAAAEADTYWCLTKLLDNIQVVLLICCLFRLVSVGYSSSVCFLIMMYSLLLYVA